MNRSKPGIATANAVVSHCFEVGQEARDQGGIEIVKGELLRRFPYLLAGIIEQETESVAVRLNRSWRGNRTFGAD